MADVFISYAREDRAHAERVARGLQAMGLDPFWDTDIPPGQTWADYIEGKLTACKAVVVLWSEHSTKSQWVREEARMGRDKSKLIPALIDGSQMPFGFGEVQAANLSTWNGDLNNTEWTRFANAVYAAANNGAAAPRPAAPGTPYRPLPSPPPQPASSSASSGAAESLSPIGYIQKCFRLYANGKGRARRSEYWWFVVFSFVVYFIAYAVDGAAFGYNPYTSQPNQQLLYYLASLVLLAPSVSVTARRFHDVGLNGWLVAVFYIAYIIAFALMAGGTVTANTTGDTTTLGMAGLLLLGAGVAQLVITLIPSRPGENKYGPNPKGQ